MDDFQPYAPESEPSLGSTTTITDDAPSDPAESAEVFADASPAADTPDDNRRQAKILEALLFASEAPITPARLADAIGDVTPGQVRKLVAVLNERYEELEMTFRIELIARGYQMMTLPEYQPWIAKLFNKRGETRLSDAALETLSIIAYRQPIIRADVEAIRGVAAGEVINRLREMGVVRIIGRAEVVGRPMLYGTTRKFLETFGLADLDDLPPIEALKIKQAATGADTDASPAEAPPERHAVAGA